MEEIKFYIFRFLRKKMHNREKIHDWVSIKSECGNINFYFSFIGPSNAQFLTKV